jgi:ferredoxin-NADP reductase
MSKLAKDVGWCDQDLAAPMEVLAGALLRCGRRTKRLGLELGAAITPFVIQYRTCKYEQMAFADRRACLKRRTEARTKADGRAAKLMMNQTMMQSVGRLGSLERMETEAAMYDEFAMEATREADEVAIRLQQEVGRISAIRVKEWDASLKIIASGMKESCAENASIWESALETFKREFPDCPEIVS